MGSLSNNYKILSWATLIGAGYLGYQLFQVAEAGINGLLNNTVYDDNTVNSGDGSRNNSNPYNEVHVTNALRQAIIADPGKFVLSSRAELNRPGWFHIFFKNVVFQGENLSGKFAIEPQSAYH